MISSVLREIARAAAEEKEISGMTQQEIADKLGVHKSAVSRLLKGQSNLTLRSVGEVLWALGWEPEFKATRKAEPTHNVATVAGSHADLTFHQSSFQSPAVTTKTSVQPSNIKLETHA